MARYLVALECGGTMVNYPDTLSFNNMATRVSGNTVTLTFTAKNAFGVPETHTMDIQVD